MNIGMFFTRIRSATRSTIHVLQTIGIDPTAEEIARAIHAGKVSRVSIDSRLQPWGNPRQAYPRATYIEGTHQGQPYFLYSADSLLGQDGDVPSDVLNLFLRLACKVSGEAAVASEYLRRNARRLRLCVRQEGYEVAINACDYGGGR